MARGAGRRRHPDAFTLIELLVVVAIIAVIAAIAIPALLRARANSNESAAIADVRTVLSGQAAYHSANSGWYERDLSCMCRKGGCVPGAPSNSPIFLDSQISSLQPKMGYSRSVPDVGPSPGQPDATISPSSVSAFVYAATPTFAGQTGARGFGGDASGRVCFTADGTVPPVTGQGALTPNCNLLR